VSLAFVGLVGRILLTPLQGFGAGTPLGWVNSVLGLLPGAARGIAIAALFVIGAATLPAELGIADSLRQSRLATPIARAGRDALGAGLRWIGIDPADSWILRTPGELAFVRRREPGVTRSPSRGRGQATHRDADCGARSIV
jgi:hypothetical protein